MRIPGACCVWVFLCGSGSRFQFRVRDFRPRTQKVFCGQEFCGFKLTFRFCDFLDVNLFCLEVFCRRSLKFFAEERFLLAETRFNTHHFDADVAISFEAGLECGCPPILCASADPPETANLRERYFCGAAIQYQSKQASYCLIAPPLDLTYLILSRT